MRRATIVDKFSRPTREDVARLAGTSTAVVSYVINDGPRPVAAGTRARVLNAISETGYRPNSIAKALANGSTGTLGFIVPDISNPFFAALAHALGDEAFLNGLVLLLGDSAESTSVEKELVESFMSRQVDGLIYIGIDNHASIAPALRSGLPVVILDRVTNEEQAASVIIDNFKAAVAGTQHLIEHGYARVGLVSGPTQLSTSELRRRGWEHALTSGGVAVIEELVVSSNFTRQGGYEAAHRLLGLDQHPDALFVMSEEQTIGALSAAAELGVKVPDDLAIVSFDGTPGSHYIVPPLTTVIQPFAQIAKHAMAILRSPDAYASNRVMPQFELRVRRSCGCNYPRVRESPQLETGNA